MTTTHRGPEHQTICDQTTLGWVALRVEEERGPDLCVTVSELRRAREEFRDAGLLPFCDCPRIQLGVVQREIDQARKSGDTELRVELLSELHHLADAWGIDLRGKAGQRSRR